MADQVKEFLAQAVPAVGTPPVAQDAPRVPFQSDLKLTGRQEKRLLEHAFKRYRTLNNDSGREQTMTPIWWANSSAQWNQALAAQGTVQVCDTFMGKRSRFDATFLNDVSWRPFAFPSGNIFNDSNLAVPLVRRIARQMIARAKNAFLGTDPWFSITPAPVPEYDAQDDAGRVERIQRFCRFKLHESASKDDKARAISRALILGEVAVKTSYVVRDQFFGVEARVLTDVTGEPMRGADGNHITEEDQFVDAEDGTGRQVLKRDGQTEMPEAPIYQTVPLNRRQVLFEGARSEPIFYKDFLCPITATDVQTADCVIHLYDKAVAEFVDLVVKRGMVGDGTPERLAAAQKMVSLIKIMSDNSPLPKAAQNAQLRPNDNFSNPPDSETGGPIAEFAEFWITFDADEDGVAENILLIADRNSQAPIFYDHVANVTTDGLRPIQIVRINPVEGRWYGLGIMELFESYQTVVDLLTNRWNFSQSRSGRVDFWRPTDTQEGDRDPSLKMNWGSTYTAKPGAKIDEILKSVYLTDIKFADIQTMMQFFIQLCLNESGVATANDAQAAGMASSELATGILETTKSGDELFRPIIQDLKPDLEKLLTREIDVTLANMNPEECYTFLEGDTLGIDRLTPDDVRGLKFKAVISLTLQKDQERMQVAQAASGLVERFYQLSPEIQKKVAPFYRTQLRTLDPSVDAATVIVPNEPQADAPEPTKSGVNVSIKWETLTPEEKTLFASKIGVDDANPPPAAPTKKEGESGSVHKLGDMAPNTKFATQLTQRVNKKAS